LFDPRKEKDTYTQARKELMEIEWITLTSTTPLVYDRPPIYDMPPVYDHSERKVEKLSMMRSFLKSFLELMKDETALNTLLGIINQCVQYK
jgi:hypothetical protein